MLWALVPDPLWWSVGHPHADSSKTSLELSFRSGAPSDVPPSGICQHVFSRHREDVRNVPLTGTAASGNRPDNLHIGRIYLEVPRDTDCPGKFAICEPLAKRRAQPKPASAKTQPKRTPAAMTRSIPSEPSPVLFVPFDIRPEHPLALTDPVCSSNSREETAAMPARLVLPLAQASAIPGSGSWRSCLAPKHLRRDTHRLRAFLGYCGVVDHQHGIAAADQPICLNKQFRLHRPRISQTPAAMKWCN